MYVRTASVFEIIILYNSYITFIVFYKISLVHIMLK